MNKFRLFGLFVVLSVMYQDYRILRTFSDVPAEHPFSKWELATYEEQPNKFKVNRRSADNTSFEPMITCDKNRKHCKYVISADQMAAEWVKVFGACR